MTSKIWLASLISVGVLSGCASNGSTTESSSFVANFPKQGSALPYSVLRDDLVDAKTNQSFEIRNGGYGSAMVGNPSQANQFYALTDRGPNADYSGDYGVFPLPITHLALVYLKCRRKAKLP